MKNGMNIRKQSKKRARDELSKSINAELMPNGADLARSLGGQIPTIMNVLKFSKEAKAFLGRRKL